MSSQRSWWPRPRSSENGPSNLKRSQLVSALSFTSRSKPKRASDIVASPRDPDFSDGPLIPPSGDASAASNNHSNLTSSDPFSKIPLSSTRPPKSRTHSKTLPSNTQRPNIPSTLKLDPGSGWSSKLGITSFGTQKKTSSISSTQPTGPSFPRLTLSKRDRLPLPKAPPQVDLPPTPTTPNSHPAIRPSIREISPATSKTRHDDGALSPLSSTSKSSVQSSRVETLSLRPSVSSGTGTTRESLVRSGMVRGDQTINISPIEVSSESFVHTPENRGFLDAAPSFGPQRTTPPTKHLIAPAAPRRQASLQQIKNTVAPSHSLRHVNSFSPSLVGEVDSEPYVYIPTSITAIPSESLPPNTSWCTTGEQLSRDSKYSNPETSLQTTGEDFRYEDRRSVFSLPSENVEGLAPQQGVVTRMQRQHMTSTDEVSEWMKTSANSGISHHPDTGVPENRDSERSPSHDGSGVVPPPIMSSSLSYSSDDQSSLALRPPPRKRLGLTARKQAAVRKKQSAAASQPPVSGAIRKLEHTNTATTAAVAQPVRRTRPPSLHRSASFLTLDEEDDRANGHMLTKEPTGPVAGWDSDTASEEESFFDFGRGVNSMELSEGLSD